ncbi:MAG: hypothetical protein JNN07_18755 [Verrucomicrobiales bacterium]|nr:hypothetical protein [Verrucomicrobiales bacterium]
MLTRIAIVWMFGLVILSTASAADGRVAWWATTEALTHKLTPQPDLSALATAAAADAPSADVKVDATIVFQTMLGMGASLEATTCSNLWRMLPEDRELLMTQLVDPASGIGMNLMRVCIGSSDFTGDPWYTYNDLDPGVTDTGLRRFSIRKDKAYVLPMLRLALRKNPKLLFFASPWSPPGWMKTSGSVIGGSLLPKYYSVYADYFVRFVRSYQAEGVPIYAVTVQNEPGVDRQKEKDPKWFYPSCHWTGEQERDFIRDHLGPAFRRAGLKTKIWCYDHNYNLVAQGDDAGLPHPRTILSDPRAAAFVDGVAFHGYVGEPGGMTAFHQEFPRKPIHFTEGSVFGFDGAGQLLDRLRNWASSYNAWVVMLDDQGKPNNGPFPATHAIVKLNSKTLQPERLLEYYVYGQFMRFVQRGAVRIESTSARADLKHVAFRNPDGKLVLVVVHCGTQESTVRVGAGAQAFSPQVLGKSINTFVWTP